MRKKGQTAMEYLMTYGWAILIVIVVVAALYSMGVFTVSPGVPCSPCFSNFGYSAHNSSHLFITVGTVKSINITNVTDDDGDWYDAGGPAGNPFNNPLSSGTKLTLSGTGSFDDGDVITIEYKLLPEGIVATPDTATLHTT